MFEQYEYDSIMERLLSNVPDNIDKREGSIIWDALAPVALELSNFYIHLDMVINECFADTASYYYLIKRAAERGMYPKEASKAILKIEVLPVDCKLEVGTRFNLDDLNYIVVSEIATGSYRVECEEEGRIGNQQFGRLLPIEYVEGLESAILTEVLIPGEEEEEEEAFRERYFASFQKKAFGGNKAEYMEQVKKIDGVGGVKVYPAWNGGGTVKIVILSSEYKEPSEELIEVVQTTLDPVENGGEGVGIAPIGHVVTVEGVSTCSISIQADVTYQNGKTFEDLKESMEQVVEQYLNGLAMQWEKEENLIVRISQLEAALLSLDGVLDITHMTLNEREENVILIENQIPVRGDVIG